MARSKQDLDDFEFDDFNFDSLDEAVEEGRGKSGPIETAKQIGKGAFDGAIKETLSVSQLRKFAKEALPSGYSLGLDAVGDTATSARELYDSAVQEIAPALPAMRRIVKRFNPKGKSWLPGFLANRLDEFANADANTSGYTQAESDNTEITSALGSIFKTQMENDARTDAEQNIRDEVREKVRYKQTDGMTRQLNAIRSATQRTSAFNDQIAYRYQQKSLELQYRSYFALRDILKNNVAESERNKAYSEAMIKASMMSDMEKLQKAQSQKEGTFKDKVTGNLKTKVSAGVNNIGKRFMRNLTTRSKDGAASIRDMITGIDDVADMIGDGNFSMANLMSSVASGLITDMFMERRYDRWKNGVSKEDRKKGFMGAVDGKISDMLKSAGVKAAGNLITSNLADWKGKLNRWAQSETENSDTPIGMILDLVKETISPQRASRAVKVGGIESLRDPTPFDNQAHRSIVEVIPGYLSRILDELTFKTTGKRSNTAYDWHRGQFGDRSRIDEHVVRDIINKSNAYKTQDAADAFIKGIMGDDFSNLRPDELAATRKALFDQVDRGMDFNPDELLAMRGRDLGRFRTAVSTMRNKSGQGWNQESDRYARAVGQWKDIRDAKGDIADIGSGLGSAYDQDTLLRTGLYKRTKNGGMEVDQDAWNRLSSGVVRPEYWKEEEKKKGGKSVAERIVRKSLSGVWDKITGKPDDSTLGRKAVGGPVGPRRWGRYAEGGPTPDGDKYQPVGTVDAGEYVMDQASRQHYGDTIMNDILKRRIPVEQLRKRARRISRDARRLARKYRDLTEEKIQSVIDQYGLKVPPLIDKYGTIFINAVDRYQAQAVAFFDANRKLASEKLETLMADPQVAELLQHGREGLRQAQDYIQSNAMYIFATGKAKEVYGRAKDFVQNTDFRAEAEQRYGQARDWAHAKSQEWKPGLEAARERLEGLGRRAGEQARGAWENFSTRMAASGPSLLGESEAGEFLEESRKHTDLLNKILTVLISKPMGAEGEVRVHRGFLDSAVLGTGKLAGRALMGTGKLFAAYVRGIGTAVGGVGKGIGIGVAGLARGAGAVAKGVGSILRAGKDRPHDTYVEGSKEPALLAKGMRNGWYSWMDGETPVTIRSFRDVEKAKGNITDNQTGDVVLTVDELAKGVYYKDGFRKRLIAGVWSGAGMLFGSAFSMTGALASLPYRAITLAAKGAGAVMKWLGSDQVDVYLPGEKNPRLRAVKMKAGMYFVADPETMKPVKTVRGWKDIIGPVYETVPGGDPVQQLSAEEARQVCDSRGNALQTPISKLLTTAAGFGLSVLKGVGSVAGGIVRGVGRIAGGAMRLAGGVIGGAFTVLGNGISTTFKKLGLKWNPKSWGSEDPVNTAQLDMLGRIYGLLDERLKKPVKRRKGGWQDQLDAQAAKLKEKTEEKVEATKDEGTSLLDKFKSLFSGRDDSEEEDEEDEESLLEKGADALDTADDPNDHRGGGRGKEGRGGKGRGKGGRLSRMFRKARASKVFRKARASKVGRGASKVGAKGVSAVKSLGKGLGKKLPLIGTLVTLGFGVKEAVDLSKRKDLDGSQKARGYGGIAGGVGGTLAGAAAGAAIGSVVPGVGTLIGGAVGAGVGTLAGTRYGKSVVNQWQHADGLEKATMFLAGGGFINAARYATKNAMRMLRMAQYGIDYKDLGTVAKIVKLEDSVMRGNIKDMDSLWDLMGLDDGITKDMTFGLMGDNTDKRVRFTKWYRGRFMPVFKVWQGQLPGSGQKSFDDMNKAPKDSLKRIIDAVYDGPKQAYSVNAHPFKDSTDFGPKEVTAVKAKALDDLGVGDGSTKPWYSKFMSKAWNKIKDVAGKAWDGAKSVASKVWGGAKLVGGGVANTYAGAAKYAAGAITGNQALRNLGSSQIGQGVGQLTESVKEVFGGPRDFFYKALTTLRAKAAQLGVAYPNIIAMIGAAQSSLETGFGKHAPNNNYFGIKGPNFKGAKQTTKEVVNGKWVTVSDSFRGYSNFEESATDYIRFLMTNRPYKSLLAASTIPAAVQALQSSGYATDPGYGKKVLRILAMMGMFVNGMMTSAGTAAAATPATPAKPAIVAAATTKPPAPVGAATATKSSMGIPVNSPLAKPSVTSLPAVLARADQSAPTSTDAPASTMVTPVPSSFSGVTSSAVYTPTAAASTPTTPPAVEPVREPPPMPAIATANAAPAVAATAGKMANADVSSGMTAVLNVMQQQLAVQTRMASSLDLLAKQGIVVSTAAAAQTSPAASAGSSDGTTDGVSGKRPAQAIPMNPPIDVRRKYA